MASMKSGWVSGMRIGRTGTPNISSANRRAGRCRNNSGRDAALPGQMTSGRLAQTCHGIGRGLALLLYEPVLTFGTPHIKEMRAGRGEIHPPVRSNIGRGGRGGAVQQNKAGGSEEGMSFHAPML